MKKFLIIGCIAIACSSVCTKAMDSNTNLGTTEQTTEAAVSNEDNAGEDINNMTYHNLRTQSRMKQICMGIYHILMFSRS